MKLIATNIFDFTAWYKFGYKFIYKDEVIDVSIDNFTGYQLLQKVGFFEEEYDIFFLEISSSHFKDNEVICKLSLNQILNIIPLTERGSNILSTKLPDFKFTNPINPTIGKLLIEERNKELAINGADRLLASFGIPKIDLLDKYQYEYLISLSKYSEDLNSELDSMMDSLLFYERSKPYPLTDLGFLYDVGGITMSRFNITEREIKEREILKENDFAKYENIEEIIALSKFLQSIKDEKVWSHFLSEYIDNDRLIKLNNNLSLVNDTGDINNILIIAYYQKFRYLIRNTADIEDSAIKKIIEKFYTKVPKETTIALYLVGMFFGSLKFKDIYYKVNPLSISRPVLKLVSSPQKESISKGKRKISNTSKSHNENEDFSDKNSVIMSNSNEFITNQEKDLDTFISTINESTSGSEISKTFDDIIIWFNASMSVSITNKPIWHKVTKSFLPEEYTTLNELNDFINKNGYSKILTKNVKKELLNLFKI